MERLFKHLDIFCTLVHRSALDFEPGTKRHNIWYPVQELLEMLPYGWAKTEPIPLMNGGLGQGGENGREKNISPYFLPEWKWKWEFKVLFFNPQNTRKHFKSFLVVFESSMFKMPAKTPSNCKTKRIKAYRHPSLLLKDSKTQIQGALFPCKRENN